MKYFLVFSPYGYYEIEHIGGDIYSAETKEQLFEFIYKKPLDYEITEKDIPAPVRENYKSDRSYHQALNSFKALLPERLDKERARWKTAIYEFEHNIVELSIPCNESEIKLIQNFEI